MINRFLFLASLLLSVVGAVRGGNWIVEAEGDAKVTWSADSVADIHAPGGLTLWYKSLMRGNVVIEYEARIVSDGRVSDLNCFWMASEPGAGSALANAKRRGGRFVDTYTMSLYYVGYGGNHNSTTRFRRYDGDARGVKEAAHRPAILREYTDSAHLLRSDHWYKVRLEAVDGRVRYIIDGECLVDYVDPKPLTEGLFGFRTTLSHAQFRNFTYRCWNPDNEPIALRDVRKSPIVTDTPATFGVPFAQGELPAGGALTLLSDGKAVPSDQWTLASWPDGTVKWKAVAAVVPHGTQNLALRKTLRKERRPVAKGVFPEFCRADNGDLFDSVTVAGSTVMGRAWVEMNGERQPVTAMKCERQGDIRQCWLAEGRTFSMRIYTYRGSKEMKIVHTSFIDSATNAKGLESLSLRFEVPMGGEDYERRVLFLMDSTVVQTMDVKPLIARRPILMNDEGRPEDERSRTMVRNIAAWDGFRLSQLSPLAFSLRKRATSLSPWIGTIEGRRAPGVVAVGGRQSGVAFHLTDFWQSYPSTIQVDGARGDKATVALFLWSREAERMRFEHYDTVAHTLEAAYEDVQPGMSTADGIARTSTLYIYMGLPGIDSLRNVLPLMANHAQFVSTPEYLHRKRAFGFWSIDSGTALDSLLSGIVTYYAQQQEKHQWYGFFNYGDVMHSYDFGRGEWRYDVGGYAWDNTELSTPAMLWYQFLRTGDATTWRMAVAMSRHNAEVDCYHRGPHAGLGTRHNVLHWGCGAKEARISQAFWNRFLYYLTADERMGDVMHEVADADQLLYKLDPMRLAQPRSSKYPCTAPARLRVGPDWLAYSANWFTEWERTGDVKYRDKILAGMRSIAAMPHGLFSGPKALGYDPATGVVTWEGDTAVQNTNHLLPIMGGFEIMNEMMLSLSTPEWDMAWLQHAIDYKHKALTISRNHFRIPRLQAYAWWHTGRESCRRTAYSDLKSPFPILYTNDAATFALDAIFMQEVAR